MYKFLVKIILVLLPVFLILVSVNYFGDAANLFSVNFEQKVALGILSGSNVTNVTDYNERLLQKYVVTESKVCPQILVLGSSRSLEIHSSYFPGKTFYNNSVSGATIEDLTAIYELYEQKNCRPEQIILCLDPWTLNKNNEQVRWQSLTHEYNIFRQNQGMDTLPITGNTNKYLQLISPSYFNGSLRALRRSKKPLLTKKEMNEDMTRLSDGSISYGIDHRNLTPAQIETKAKEYAMVNNIYSVEKFDELSPDTENILERFIAKLLSEKIAVTFFLSPYNPIVYHVFETNDQYKEIKASEIYYRELAAKNNIHVLGSFDPNTVGMDGSFFYDGMHSNKKGIDQLMSSYNLVSR